MSTCRTNDVEWVPPAKVEELFASTAGNKFASINAPTAGARSPDPVPVGDAPFQYYSLATPNGQKPAILLEELGIDYDAHKIGLMGDQFKEGFVNINPNSKIPAAVDRVDGREIKLFESDKYQRFIPSDPALRAEVMNWLFWQVGGQGPITGACFGHFFVYAPDDRGAAREYALARYGMEVQRLCSVLENHLKDRSYMVNEEYTIADMAIYPWFNQLLTGYNHKSGLTAKDFLSVEENYPSVVAWALRIRERPAVQRGLQVCPWNGAHTKPWLAPSTQEDEN